MIYILSILCILMFAVATSLSLIFNMHMFQLNSYKADVQIKWIKANKNKFYLNILFIIISVLAIFIDDFAGVVLLLLFIFAAFISRPKKAKKPLVYTNRVKRMLTTVILIYALYGLLTVLFLPFYFALCIGYALSPFAVLLANLINKPIENAINNHYIKDAKRLLKGSNVTVIGITGSYGKTSVKYFLSSILRAKFNVLMTPESYNTPMGIVKTIRGSLKATHEIFICEMGAKNIGDIKEICDIVNPTHGIVSSIGPQHLESFKTIENIINTKYELADSLPSDGLLFLNNESPVIKENKPSKSGITYGLDEKNDYVGYDITVSKNGTSFNVKTPSGETEQFQTKLIGEHNVVNILGAIAVAHSLGINLSDIKPQVRRLEGVPHRLQLIKRNGITIIDDAYNSNPSGTKAALKTLSVFDGHKILVTPGMIELGDKQEEYNHKFGVDAAMVCDVVVLVGENQTKSIYKGLTDVNFDKAKIYVAKDLTDALNYVYSLNCEKDKIVLLENDLPDNY